MWYDTHKEYWLNTEIALQERLMEIAEDNFTSFSPDELIDEVCSSVNYFGKIFYPSQIIKKLDLNLYLELQYERMEEWIEEVKYLLNHSEPKEGESILSQFCVCNYYFPELEAIIWKESE